MKRVVFLLLIAFMAVAFTSSGALAASHKKCSTEKRCSSEKKCSEKKNCSKEKKCSSEKKCSKKKTCSAGHHKGGAHGGFFDKMIKKLDLSEDQLVEAGKIKNAYKKSVIKQQADIKIAGVELQELLTVDDVNLKKAKRKVKSLHAMKADLQYFRITEMENFKKILTPEQKKKLKSCAIKGSAGGKDYKHSYKGGKR